MTRFLATIVLSLLGLTISAATQEMPSKHKEKEEVRNVAQVLDQSVTNLESEFIPASDAMPEDKFGFAPSNGEFKGVRTFAEQIKHVASVNYELAAAILQQKPPVNIYDEAGPASITSKADIMQYLKESFEYVHKAIATINEKNLVQTVPNPWGERKVTRLTLANSVLWHGYDHYGQMVEYLRMNGIVPPASRR